MTEKVTKLLESFEKIPLTETSSLQLLDRYDTKYTFQLTALLPILEECRASYLVTTVRKERIFSYETWYYDTPSYQFYNAHHNGKMHRYKIRYRHYEGFDLIFAEVKEKFKGKTFKKRVSTDKFNDIGAALEDEKFKGEASQLLKLSTPFLLEELQPVLKVCFQRITLVNRNRMERITIDTGLTYQAFGIEKGTEPSQIVIAEIKHQGLTPKSEFSKILKDRGIHPASFSKYCTGIAHLTDGVKKNNFKRQLAALQAG